MVDRGDLAAWLTPGLARRWGGIVTVPSTLRPTGSGKRRPSAPPSDESVLQESAPFPGADSWPGNHRLRRRRLRPSQPCQGVGASSLWEAAPFYGADSQEPAP